MARAAVDRDRRIAHAHADAHGSGLLRVSDRRNDEWKKYQPAIQGLMDQMGIGDLSWEDSAAAFDALGREHDLPRWHYERRPSMEGSGK